MAAKRRKYYDSAKALAYNAAWRAAHPERHNAHNAVAYALSTGKLERPERCDQCGEPCRPHAHHDDYSRPLDVRWPARRATG